MSTRRPIEVQNDKQPQPVMGRPRVGDQVLPAITVPGELREALERTARALGISLPEARRRAYEEFVR